MTIRSHMTAIWQCHMAYGNMVYCVLLESLVSWKIRCTLKKKIINNYIKSTSI